MKKNSYIILIIRFFYVILQKEKMKKIELPNRDGLKYFLEEISENTFILKGPDYPMSVSYFDNECTQIKFIDPSGGYPIAVGSKIDNMIVKEIKWTDKLYIIF